MPTRPITVGTTATQILSYNNERTAATFTNNGAATIFVSEDQANILTDGHPISVGGALDLLRALGDEPQLEWFAQVAVGAENLRVLEAFGELPALFRPPAIVSQGP